MSITRSAYIPLLLTAVVVFAVAGVAAGASDAGRDEFIYAKRLMEEGYYDLAAEQFERVLRDFPGISETAEAQFLLGKSFLLAEDYERARAAFLKTALVYADSPWAPEALFNVAVSLEKLGDREGAAEAYLRVQSFHPGHNLAPEGLSRAIGLYFTVGDTAAARDAVELLIREYPESLAADAARLTLADLALAGGDRETARRYLKWVAERGVSDSLTAVARLHLGRMARGELRFDEAESAFRGAVKTGGGVTSAQARLELADLLTVRGLTAAALEAVEPLLDSPDADIAARAGIETGDALFQRGDYKGALGSYHSVGLQPEALLKAAWCAEKLRSPDTALKRYVKVAALDVPEARSAVIRAGVLAGELGRREEAAVYWRRVFHRFGANDTSGVIMYRALVEISRVGDLPVRDARGYLQRHPRAPFADEIAYITYKSVVLQAAGKEGMTPPDAAKRFALYPASAYLDSALMLERFFQRRFHQAENLMALMADLSSRPAGTVDPVDWSLQWGDFYLDSFKDPVKAIDHYNRALDYPKIAPDKRRHALGRGTEAYLDLYEEALWFGDRVAARMYGDNARNRLEDAAGKVLGSTLRNELRRRLLMLQAQDPNLEDKAQILQAGLELFGEDTTAAPESAAEFLEWALQETEPDSSAWTKLLGVGRRALARSPDARTAARLRWCAMLFSDYSGGGEVDSDSAAALWRSAPKSPGGARACWWLVERSHIPAVRRYELLREYGERYPYLIDPQRYWQTAALLLDSLHKPLESLEAAERAAAVDAWLLPDIDILSGEYDVGGMLRYGRAFLAAGRPTEAAEQFSRAVNLLAGETPADSARLGLAQSLAAFGQVEAALAHLDTLRDKFPFSGVTAAALHLRARMEMAAGRFAKAQQSWEQLAQGEADPDSAVFFAGQAVVCLYRQGELEAARVAAKQIYKRFRKRDDLDDYKAQFYLEKGRALEQRKQFEDARKQFDLVTAKFPLTPWADDAAYASGLSLIAQGDSEGGTAALERFVENHPASDLLDDALLSLGLAYHRMEKYAEAAATLRRIWEDPDAGNAWGPAFQALVSVYKASRFWDAALFLTRDYLKRFPEAPDHSARLMDIGWLYLQMGEWDEAVRQYRSLFPIADPEDEAEAQYYIGEALLAKGDYRSALLEFLKVKILGRKTKLDWGVTALYKAGNCYEKLGDAAGAERMYERIIRETGAASNYGIAAQKRLDSLKKAEPPQP